jgi:hypothetical protein
MRSKNSMTIETRKEKFDERTNSKTESESKFARNSSTTTISETTESLVIASDISAAKRSVVNDADDEMNRINVDEEKKRTDSEKTRIMIMSDHESVRRDEETTEASFSFFSLSSTNDNITEEQDDDLEMTCFMRCIADERNENSVVI